VNEVDLPGARALFSTRRGGVSEGPYASLNLGLRTDDDPVRVTENRRRVQARAAVRALLHGRQVHGVDVAVEGVPGEAADAQVTARRGVAPFVSVADCLPIALLAPGAVAMVHAGWRGLAGGIVAAAVAAVRARSPQGDLVAAIGPGAGACCYEVGPDVHAAFGTTGRTLDLKGIAAGQLATAGLDDVHDCGLCTMCADPRLFFSHRRDGGVTGRQAGLAWST
jgi:polyphenol oxidase